MVYFLGLGKPGVDAYLSLGSNVGDRENCLRHAIGRLSGLPRTTVRCLSSMYETEPWGEKAQDPFLNLCAGIYTGLRPRPLFKACKKIETDLGRCPGRRWGPREIDIDLLLYGASMIRIPGLTVPHPRMAERRFVLVPLSEIAARVVVPGFQKTVAELVEICSDSGRIHRFHGTSDSWAAGGWYDGTEPGGAKPDGTRSDDARSDDKEPGETTRGGTTGGPRIEKTALHRD